MSPDVLERMRHLESALARERAEHLNTIQHKALSDARLAAAEAELREVLDTSAEPSDDIEESNARRTLRRQRDAQTRRLRECRAELASLRARIGGAS